MIRSNFSMINANFFYKYIKYYVMSKLWSIISKGYNLATVRTLNIIFRFTNATKLSNVSVWYKQYPGDPNVLALT